MSNAILIALAGLAVAGLLYGLWKILINAAYISLRGFDDED